jgi:DNA polymerase III delta subunit
VVVNMVYLFIGEDSLSKDIHLKKIKQEFLSKGTEQFNFETLYAKEITLKDLQEALLRLPVNSPKRILVLKDAQRLKEDGKEFILKYLKSPYRHIVLILDIEYSEKRDEFINRISKITRIIRFREIRQLDTFTLNRQIELKKPDLALKVLNQILKEGERPERILGGLRYAWERGIDTPFEMKKRLSLLLNCDLEIKTGKLKPAFALEKLVINLCGSGKPLH